MHIANTDRGSADAPHRVYGFRAARARAARPGPRTPPACRPRTAASRAVGPHHPGRRHEGGWATMTGGWAEFGIAFAAFMASHVVPARPGVRRRLVAALGALPYSILHELRSASGRERGCTY